MVPEEAMNCVNECISAQCNALIYAEEPLEDGEIDNVRDQKFRSCVFIELRNEF